MGIVFVPFFVLTRSILALKFSLDLSREEVAIAKRYPPQTALCLRDGWEFCKSELAAGTKSVIRVLESFVVA